MKTFIVDRQITDQHGRLTNTEFRRAMEMLDASLDEMSDHLGVCRRLVADYRRGKEIPSTVAYAVRYLLLLAAAPKTAERMPRLVEWRGVIDR